MKNIYSLLQNSPLFKNITESEFLQIIGCLNAAVKTYEKGCFILNTGDPVRCIGVLLSGQAEIVKEDVFGRKTIITVLGPSDLFGEALACAGKTVSPVSILAIQDTGVLWMDYVRMIQTCSSVCGFHSLLIGNMMRILAEKSIILNKRIDYLLIKGLREKISMYLLEQHAQAGYNSFDIPLNREQLADFLSADRSALSRELCRMRDEGLISFHKNRFTLLSAEKDTGSRP